MNCPVCGATADDITDRQFDGLSVRCSICGDYDIAGTVHDSGMLAKREPEERKAALEKAKRSTKPEKRPMITSYTL